MTTSSHPRAGAARYLRTSLVFLLTLGLAVLGFAADAARKSFNIAADDAARALKQFAAQSGEQLLYSPSDVAGVKTLAIKGELTAREALEQMLAGTTLVVAQDKSTGALAVRKETAAEAKNAPSRRAEAPTAKETGGLAGLITSGGTPVVGARVKLAASGEFVVTDRTGHFEFDSVPVGAQALLIRSEHTAAVRVTDINVRASVRTTLDTIELPARTAGLLEENEIAIPAAKLSEVLKLKRFDVVARKFTPFSGGNVDMLRTQDDAQPYFIFDNTQVERSGVTSMADFLQKFVPMNFTRRQPESDPGLLNGTTTLVSLFGNSGAAQTLILINGRRQPGIFIAGTAAQPDLNGIPMSAIDRIEILPASASAIYGGAALGGVINVVLKQNYVGGEVKTTYENTFDVDAPQRSVSLTTGMTLEGGRTHVLVSLTASERQPLLIQDRDYLVDYTTQASIARFGLNSPGVPWYGATSNITTGSATVPLTLKAAYGGTSLGSSITSLPVGYNGVAASGVAGLIANAGRYNYGTPNTRYSSSAQGIGALYPLTQRAEMQGVDLSVRRRMLPWLELYGTYFLHQNRSFAGALPSDALGGSNGLITVPAAAPTNPFTTAVAMFAPINSGIEERRAESISQQFVIGAQIDLPGHWKAQLEYNYGDNRFSYNSPATYGAGLSADILSGAFDPFRDLIALQADLLKYRSVTDYVGNSVTEDYSARLAGPVWTLPAGEITASSSLGQLESGNKRSTSTTTIEHYPTATANGTTIYPSNLSTTTYGHLELNVPVFGDKFRRPLLERLDFQVAGRIDDYKSTQASSYNAATGAPASISRSHRRTHNETTGMRWSPVKDVTLRASYSSAFTPPLPSQLLPSTSTPTTTTVTDPRRGNAATLVQTLGGGNPSLGPETSDSVNIGVIITPRWVPGLRLSTDYARVTRYNSISTLGTQALVNLESTFPGRITRAAASTDATYGIGAITFVDTSSLNLLKTQMESYNFSADYALKTASWGSWTLSGRASAIQHYRYQTSFTTPMIEAIQNETQTTFGLIPKLKGNLNLTWDRGPWTAGWTTRYTGHYVQALTFQAAQGSRFVPDQMYHDVFGEYRFGKRSAAFTGIGRHLLDNVSLQVGVKNVFDVKPPRDVASSGLGYSYYGDYRLASYWVSLKKNF